LKNYGKFMEEGVVHLYPNFVSRRSVASWIEVEIRQEANKTGLS
jgi:hypothetical protein